MQRCVLLALVWLVFTGCGPESGTKTPEKSVEKTPAPVQKAEEEKANAALEAAKKKRQEAQAKFDEEWEKFRQIDQNLKRVQEPYNRDIERRQALLKDAHDIWGPQEKDGTLTKREKADYEKSVKALTEAIEKSTKERDKESAPYQEEFDKQDAIVKKAHAEKKAAEAEEESPKKQTPRQE